jgi:hypothetical protein
MMRQQDYEEAKKLLGHTKMTNLVDDIYEKDYVHGNSMKVVKEQYLCKSIAPKDKSEGLTVRCALPEGHLGPHSDCHDCEFVWYEQFRTPEARRGL